MNQEHVRLIEKAAALQTSHEIDRLLELFLADAVFEDVALGIVANGHAMIREMFESIYASMPDYAQTVVSTVTDGDRRCGMDHVGDAPGRLPRTSGNW